MFKNKKDAHTGTTLHKGLPVGPQHDYMQGKELYLQNPEGKIWKHNQQYEKS